MRSNTCFEFLIYLLNLNENYGENGEIKSLKSMLIKFRHPTLSRSRFPLYNLMNC